MSDYTEHPDYRAHLAGIVADPADDTRRLVLCDWLEELQTPDADRRAEFIRVQIHLANLTGHYHTGNRECSVCDQVSRWLGREEVLFGQEAYGPKPNGLRARTSLDHFGLLDSHQIALFTRGFVSEVRCSLWRTWLSLGKDWVTGFPLERVTATDARPYRSPTGCHWLCEGIVYRRDRNSYTHIDNRLPQPIFRSRHISDGDTPVNFLDETEAHLALSRAALEWARERRTQ